MRTRARWFAVSLALLLLPVDGVRAGEDEESEAKSREEEVRVQKELAQGKLRIYAGTDRFVGDERLSDAETKSVIDHYPSFAEVWRGEGADTLGSRVYAHLRKTGRYDPSIVLDMKEYKAWAGDRGLDGRAWLRRAFRAELLIARAGLEEGLEEFRKQVEELEDLRSAIENEELEKLADEARSILTIREETIAAIPAPTEEEKKALEKHEKALEALFG